MGLYDASGTTGSDKEYRIAAHTDRGAYRPGDTVQLFGLVRGSDNTAPKTGLPIHLTIKDGRGQIVRQQTLNTNAAGVFTHTLNLADHSNTGTWTADWYVKGGNKSEYLGEQRSSFKVENLVPERLSVRSIFGESDVLGGSDLAVLSMHAISLVKVQKVPSSKFVVMFTRPHSHQEAMEIILMVHLLHLNPST